MARNHEYRKLEADDVYKTLVGTSVDFMNPIQGAISVKEIARLRKTSRYQVKKQIDKLREKGFVELRMFNLNDEYEAYPPYWGYVLTEKGKDTDYYREADEAHNKMVQECFGV